MKFVRVRTLCENCLSYTHFAPGCKSPRACSVDQCSISCKHMGSLHDALLASLRRRQEENRKQGPCVGPRSNLMQPQSGHVVMKSDISIAGGLSHEYKTLPIAPVKLKEGARARSLQHMPCSITAQHRPGAVRVRPRS